MDSLDLIRTFREVASQGSFSHADKKLDMSKATVRKYVAELETLFGVRLLNRSTRSVSLTEAGQLLLERSTPVVVDTVREAVQESLGRRQPVLEALLREKGLSLDDCVQPLVLPH